MLVGVLSGAAKRLAPLEQAPVELADGKAVVGLGGKTQRAAGEACIPWRFCGNIFWGLGRKNSQATPEITAPPGLGSAVPKLG